MDEADDVEWCISMMDEADEVEWCIVMMDEADEIVDKRESHKIKYYGHLNTLIFNFFLHIVSCLT
jgi:hypothetical protein